MTLSYQTRSPENKIWYRQVDVPVDPHKIPIQGLKYFCFCFLLYVFLEINLFFCIFLCMFLRLSDKYLYLYEPRHLLLSVSKIDLLSLSQ